MRDLGEFLDEYERDLPTYVMTPQERALLRRALSRSSQTRYIIERKDRADSGDKV